jgi:cellobiose-specific phosphotransferase system component IIC
MTDPTRFDRFLHHTFSKSWSFAERVFALSSWLIVLVVFSVASRLTENEGVRHAVLALAIIWVFAVVTQAMALVAQVGEWGDKLAKFGWMGAIIAVVFAGLMAVGVFYGLDKLEGNIVPDLADALVRMQQDGFEKSR